MNSSFYNIGLESKSDKIHHHGYHFVYSKYLESYRDLKDVGMIEIGIENKFSLNLWLNYFPNMFIYGMDIHVEASGDRFQIWKGDQSNTDNLNALVNNIEKPVCFIIDDGSHIPEHQILTFDILFEKLLPGGIYIIEDIETSYWSKNYIYQYNTNYGFHHPNSVLEFFKLLIDDINSEFLTTENKNKQTLYLKDKITEKNRDNISSITFYHNCIIIMKKTKEEIEFYGKREYIWNKNL